MPPRAPPCAYDAAAKRLILPSSMPTARARRPARPQMARAGAALLQRAELIACVPAIGAAAAPPLRQRRVLAPRSAASPPPVVRTCSAAPAAPSRSAGSAPPTAPPWSMAPSPSRPATAAASRPPRVLVDDVLTSGATPGPAPTPARRRPRRRWRCSPPHACQTRACATLDRAAAPPSLAMPKIEITPSTGALLRPRQALLAQGRAYEEIDAPTGSEARRQAIARSAGGPPCAGVHRRAAIGGRRSRGAGAGGKDALWRGETGGCRAMGGWRGAPPSPKLSRQGLKALDTSIWHRAPQARGTAGRAPATDHGFQRPS